MDNMFNPEMMNMVNQVMSNPDSMNQIMQMMQDPSIQQMMNNPEFMKSMGSQINTNSNSNKDRELSIGDGVLTVGLKSDNYNNKEGVIKGEKNNRYLVHLSELEKTISIKKDNLQLRSEEEETEEDSEVIEVEGDSDVTTPVPTPAPTPAPTFVHEPVHTPSPDENVTEESGEGQSSKTETEDN